MRVAALDLGSNSFHLLVADVFIDGHLRPVTREKEMLRLGDAVSSTGRLGPDLCDKAVASVRRLRGIADGAGAGEILAKATSAIRSAADGSDLVDRIEAETGVHVDVIDGLEEARLIFEAVRAAVLIDPGPALCLDLGGGSLEISVGDPTGVLWATSEHLGVGRLTTEYVRSDPLTKSDRKALEAHVREVLTPLATCVRSFAPRMAVGSSGTLSDLVAMARAADGAEVSARNQLTASASEILALHERIVKSVAKQRRRMPGLDPKRVELLPAGSCVLATAIHTFGIEALTVSDWALREGIVLDAVERHPGEYTDEPRDLRHSAVLGLAQRCNSDAKHTAQVERLAMALFDALEALHDLDDHDRELLAYAALLHDIGQHVSRRKHHKHAAYLVMNGELRGFDPEEVSELAALLRHHRHGTPKPTEQYLAALEPTDQQRVVRMAAILRLADGLDRGRHSRVETVDAQVAGDLVILRVEARSDPELEIWGARRRRGLFEKVFEREVEVVRTAGGHDL